MLDLIDTPMVLMCYVERTESAQEIGTPLFAEPWYDDWLQSVVADSGFIFFFLIVSTEVFKEDFKEEEGFEINFNTVVSSSDDGKIINHTFAPECPPGCHGQLDDCKLK